MGGGLGGGGDLCLLLGGLAEGDDRRGLRGGLVEMRFTGFFGGDRDRDEEEEELLPEVGEGERLLLTGDLLLLCLGGGGMRLGGLLLRGEGRLLGLGLLLGE